MANFTSMTTYDFYFIAVVSVMAGFAIGVTKTKSVRLMLIRSRSPQLIEIFIVPLSCTVIRVGCILLIILRYGIQRCQLLIW